MPDLRGRLLANESLSPLTWFRVGGPAQILFTPADEDDLAYFLSNLPKEIAVYVVGVGSNLVVRDGGIKGVVIRLSPKGFGDVKAEGDTIRAGTAVLDKRVAEAAADRTDRWERRRASASPGRCGFPRDQSAADGVRVEWRG